MTRAALQNIPVELYLAQNLADQVRKRLDALLTSPLPARPGEGLDRAALRARLMAKKPVLHSFQPLTNTQQRSHWTKDLAKELVIHVLKYMALWVVVFDHCEQAPPEAHEFVRQLVALTAGVDRESAKDAHNVPLSVVLLGDSTAMLPNPVWNEHIIIDDLTAQTLEAAEVEEYFKVLHLCRLDLNLDPSLIPSYAAESLARAHEIADTADEPVPWPRALATAVIEKTLASETQVRAESLAEQRRGQ